MSNEIFDIFDENDQLIGQAARSECHGNPALIHRVAHVLVFNSQGALILQKRSPHKDIQPGKWDTSVGGHLLPGESYEAGAYRGMFGSYLAGDRIRVGIEDGVVRYRRNGVAFYESLTLPSPGQYPFVLDASLNAVGSTVENATIGGALTTVFP